ncbi:UNVERIFIED_CONTAM: hypothetical protein NCL1_22311 [Trichonephila clavipes]
MQQAHSNVNQSSGQREDECSVRFDHSDPSVTVTNIQKAHRELADHSINTRTTSRRFLRGGTKLTYTVTKIAFDSIHHRRRLEWCVTRWLWGVERH